MFQLSQTTAAKTFGTNSAAAGTNSVITLNAVSKNFHVVDWISWSYAAAPTNGQIRIVNNTASNAVLAAWDITAAGPGQLPIPAEGFECPQSAQISVFLVDGNVTSKLNIGYR